MVDRQAFKFKLCICLELSLKVDIIEWNAIDGSNMIEGRRILATSGKPKTKAKGVQGENL